MKKKAKAATPDIEQELAAREKVLTETFREMIKTIDNYLRVSPLAFNAGRDSEAGEYIFPDHPSRFINFYDWIERWMGALYPRTLEDQAKIAANEAGDDEYMDLCYNSERFGFLLGFLVGLKTMGASDGEAMHRVHGFTIQNLGWTAWNAKQQAKGN